MIFISFFFAGCEYNNKYNNLAMQLLFTYEEHQLTINNISPKNKHWARYSSIKDYYNSGFGFSLAEVNLMECQLLSLLDWNIRINLEDLYCQLQLVFIVSHGQHSRQTIQSASTINIDVLYAHEPLKVHPLGILAAAKNATQSNSGYDAGGACALCRRYSSIE
jgi:hypothetical protein